MQFLQVIATVFLLAASTPAYFPESYRPRRFEIEKCAPGVYAASPYGASASPATHTGMQKTAAGNGFLHRLPVSFGLPGAKKNPRPFYSPAVPDAICEPRFW